MSKATNKVKGLFKRLNDFALEAVNPVQMKLLGNEAVKLIVKRTRLGYGVQEQYGQREKLKGLSQRYIRRRQLSDDLDETTRPKKSNLTFTGQMLRSLKVTTIGKGTVTIAPTGVRKDRKRNFDVAEWNARRGRTFNRLSMNEANQIVRIYRKRFGDLLGRLSLLK